MGSSPGNSLLQKCRERLRTIDPKWSDPSLDPAQAGATCTRLPFYCHNYLHWQDKENGGISDRPDNAVDIYHTYFGVAGLSLMEYPGVKPIDPAYALPLDVVNRIFLTKQQ
ncbi:hypothetical protein VPH35_128851 [Triticum aestivum]